MKIKSLYLCWAGAYSFCLLLSFIPVKAGLLQALYVLCSLAFFAPGFLLLFQSLRCADRTNILRVRLISGLSLLLTCIILLLNFLSITGSQALGAVLHALLLLVSVPMAICGNWLLSLFLWACLFVATFLKKR